MDGFAVKSVECLLVDFGDMLVVVWFGRLSFCWFGALIAIVLNSALWGEFALEG